MLDPVVEQKARAWLRPEYGAAAAAEIAKLFETQAWEELNDRFYQELEFGTGGIRGVLGAGTNRMNDIVIRLTTQGLANYLLLQAGAGRLSAVIAHDPRRRSPEFALETALVLAGNGIKAYLFRELRPTPVLSFAVRYLRATAGVVITASHNPPEYNGYKVSWSDGGQIVPPHDKGIIDQVRRVKSLDQVRWLSRAEAESRGLLVWLDDKVDEAYLVAVAGQVIRPEAVRRSAGSLKVVYTPLHGTGVTMIPRALARMGLKNVNVLASQRTPDSEFPTVKSPNPEEKAALDLAIAEAGRTGAQLVIGTDPDCDRMGLAYRDARGEYNLLNGNQIGSVLCHYVLASHAERGSLPERPVIIKTIVTTDLQREIAESFGAETLETLTGFKYIAELIKVMEEEGGQRTFLFGGEESYGYLAGTYTRDKDAVVSSQLTCEVAAWCVDRGITLGDYLDEIYARYGYFVESGVSLTLKGQEGAQQIAALMDSFRNNRPAQISGSRLAGYWDLLTNERVSLADGGSIKTNLPESNVLVYFLADSGKVSLRPSGTEPKIKFYFSVRSGMKAGEDLADAKKAGNARITRLQEDFMKMVDRRLAEL